jgi:alkyl hydroperoxide reductase subunit AhpC
VRLFVIGPDKKVNAMIAYPMSEGGRLDEVLRLLEAKPQPACTPGESVRALLFFDYGQFS